MTEEEFKQRVSSFVEKQRAKGVPEPAIAAFVEERRKEFNAQSTKTNERFKWVEVDGKIVKIDLETGEVSEAYNPNKEQRSLTELDAMGPEGISSIPTTMGQETYQAQDQLTPKTPVTSQNIGDTISQELDQQSMQRMSRESAAVDPYSAEYAQSLSPENIAKKRKEESTPWWWPFKGSPTGVENDVSLQTNDPSKYRIPSSNQIPGSLYLPQDVTKKIMF